MRIAVLDANTDDSAFARRHPDEGEKWRALLAPLRPDWRFELHAVKHGAFPEGGSFDAAIVTGSPSSVNDPDPWIGRLLALLRDLVTGGVPVYGACFGHQAVARALGGEVGPNPGGWAIGGVDSRLDAPVPGIEPGPIRLYAAHKEQVTRLPAGIAPVAAGPGCPHAGLRLGAHLLTTQYHPEFTDDFMADLVREYADALPAPVIETARASLDRPAERDRIARGIVGFLETARAATAAGR
ncbi:MAG: type 1 glutamine amidotransferase [Gemmobacter sp.]